MTANESTSAKMLVSGMINQLLVRSMLAFGLKPTRSCEMPQYRRKRIVNGDNLMRTHDNRPHELCQQPQIPYRKNINWTFHVVFIFVV